MPLIVKFLAFPACLNHSMTFKCLCFLPTFALMFVIIYATFPFLRNVMRSLYCTFPNGEPFLPAICYMNHPLSEQN